MSSYSSIIKKEGRVNIRLLLLGIGMVFLLNGCSNTLRGMKEDCAQLKPNLKKMDDSFQEKYW